MKKQLILAGSGLALVAILFIFGRTAAPKKNNSDAPAVPEQQAFDIRAFIKEEKTHFAPNQVVALEKIENGITRGDLITQKIAAYNELATFWKDSGHEIEPYLFYLSEAAKLDKSEKNLTFAAQLTLTNLRTEQDQAKLNWKTGLAIELYEAALAQNPNNDDLKIGLGSCYVFGRGRYGGAAETMKGIQQLLEVVRRDSTNMKAQMILGIGGLASGQFDKAIERLNKVVKAQPKNVEAMAYLAEAYDAHGDREEAIKWLLVTKKMVNDPHYSAEVDERIQKMR